VKTLKLIALALTAGLMSYLTNGQSTYDPAFGAERDDRR
jgi:hypothetical protein